jgi:hypothetical protein
MFLMGKSTISMAIFNSYVKLPEGNLLVLEYLRSPAKNLSFLAGYLADWP